jgi:hypothetical protein
MPQMRDGTGAAKMANAEQCCVLCATIGESRSGEIPDGGGVPLCAEHWASMKEKSRQPKAPQVVTIGSTDASELYLQDCTLAALEGRAGVGLSSLAAIAAPSSTELH